MPKRVAAMAAGTPLDAGTPPTRGTPGSVDPVAATSDGDQSSAAAPVVRWRLVLFVGVSALYLLTASGRLQTVDTAQALSVAASIRTGNGFESASCVRPGGGTVTGRNGRDYAAHDIGMTLLYLPLTLVPGTTERTDPLLAGTATDRCPQISSAAVQPTGRLTRLASIVAPLVGAALVLVFACLLVDLRFSDRTAVLCGLLMALTSIVWVYSHASFDVTPTALALLMAVWMLVRFDRDRRPGPLWGAGAAMGAAILLRTDSVLFAVPLSIPVAVAVWKARRDRVARLVPWVVAWVVPVVAAVLLNLGYNWLRFSSPFANGHADDPYTKLTGSFARGTFGQVLSPGKGMLFYTPLLILIVVQWPRFLRRHRTIAITCLATVLVSVGAHALVDGWAGDEAWGARFTVPVVALACIPLGYVVEGAQRAARWSAERLALIGVAIVGLAIQLTGVLVDYTAVDFPRLLDGTYAANELREPAFVRHAAVLWRALSSAQPYPGYDEAKLAVLRPVRFDVWFVRSGTSSGWDAGNVLVPVVLAVAAVVAGGVLWCRFREVPRLSERSPAPGGSRAGR